MHPPCIGGGMFAVWHLKKQADAISEVLNFLRGIPPHPLQVCASYITCKQGRIEPLKAARGYVTSVNGK